MLTELMKSKLLQARKAQDKIAESAYGNVIAKITLAEKSGKHTVPLQDDVVVGLIKKEVKELEETLSFYKDDTVQAAIDLKDKRELLVPYIPADLTEEQVVEIIHRLYKTEPNKGKLVGLVCREVGSKFDRSKVKPLIDKILN